MSQKAILAVDDAPRAVGPPGSPQRKSLPRGCAGDGGISRGSRHVAGESAGLLVFYAVGEALYDAGAF